ncbi:hypothetical protein EUAN_22180 [Andreesenia angusta]|uniref:Uncharacterized protein n=1 Tax=Andreesenia angusta TaxID=39480 RepID=A0A1S1V4C7_9FIRM|nr:hypothetical protein EUAN_22180 [Andreesenia angusta]
MIYNLLKRIIESGEFESLDITNKLDVFLLYERITLDQYEELNSLIGVIAQ